MKIPEVTGYISLSHHVVCPHCHETMYDDLDREWWNSNITDQLGSNESYEDTYEINCKECNNPFNIVNWIT